MLFNAGRSYELLTVCQCSSLAAWSFALPVSLAVNNAIFTINVFISAAFTTSKSEKYSGGTRPLLPSYKSMTAKWPNRAACPSIRDIIAYRRSLPSTVTPAKNRGIRVILEFRCLNSVHNFSGLILHTFIGNTNNYSFQEKITHLFAKLSDSWQQLLPAYN